MFFLIDDKIYSPVFCKKNISMICMQNPDGKCI